MQYITHETTYMQGSVLGHLSKANVFKIYSMDNWSSEMEMEWEPDDCISAAVPSLSGGRLLLVSPPCSFPSCVSDV